MTRVERVPLDSTSEAEGKATLTGSLVNVYRTGCGCPRSGWGSGALPASARAPPISPRSAAAYPRSLSSRGWTHSCPVWSSWAHGWTAATRNGDSARRPAPSSATRTPASAWGSPAAGACLLVHEDPEVREWGATLTWEPPDRGPGPSVSVAPAWGRPASGMHALWRDPQAVLASPWRTSPRRTSPGRRPVVVGAGHRGRDGRLPPGRPGARGLRPAPDRERRSRLSVRLRRYPGVLR